MSQKATPQQRNAKAAGTDIAIVEAQLGKGIATKFNAGRVVNLEWNAEKRYALSILQDPKNDYLRSIAIANPQSVADALLDASRLGLSLSPTSKMAYLVPYGGKSPKVTLAPSYIGMEQSVLRGEKITRIQTDLVYANDEFKRWTDATGAQFQHAPARKDRGEFEGVYCLAQYANGEHHLEYMGADDVEACFQAAVTKNNGKIPPAWVGGFKNEMRKKCVVRRAAKHWPADKHVDMVMEQFDRVNPMDFNGKPADATVDAVVCLSEDDVKDVLESMDRLPEAQRPVWAMNCAKAMGFDALDEVPVDKKEELVTRLVARMDKLVPKKAVEA